ncbi:Single Cache domain 2-containing protein [Methylobacterium phyllostachyos]|uniref:Single Cache domain 2-containing protein n=1 Tax=Methylobacterium phyllostachyos TaxID=582672 RepID=A0A1H0GQJ7_9HYPH|nr:cache domain-containing protein [Methylobacterium phyllostachyos]SDO09175.1 Single Cache domain 2-containing protein [Methylobacterium phyllostachyos]
MLKASMLAASLLLGLLATGPVRACGDGEAPTSCDDPSPNGFAAWMLGRVDRALVADKAQALQDFTDGARGFRTADTYVFCIGPDGVMSAHPSPILKGHDVRDLHDRTGNHFIRTMMETARPGQVSVIRYLFPKPGSTVEEPKTTYYTRAGDQTCAVGVYDADAEAPKSATADGRVAQLRLRLDRQIPAGARADWTAFLEALNAQRSEKATAIAQARRDLTAAATALESAGTRQTGGE